MATAKALLATSKKNEQLVHVPRTRTEGAHLWYEIYALPCLAPINTERGTDYQIQSHLWGREGKKEREDLYEQKCSPFGIWSRVLCISEPLQRCLKGFLYNLLLFYIRKGRQNIFFDLFNKRCLERTQIIHHKLKMAEQKIFSSNLFTDLDSLTKKKTRHIREKNLLRGWCWRTQIWVMRTNLASLITDSITRNDLGSMTLLKLNTKFGGMKEGTARQFRVNFMSSSALQKKRLSGGDS